ncbi:Uncharacterised protein [Acinetobacter baumannii]|nr:hypothetical protein BN889_05221 [Pseudomonas aeruginosa PA38182]CEI76206.1 Uncharacterized protein PAE221_01788 [Pseudomonas aeruginosa]SST11570.1 Uncharacterised protein [Acinetobacter baumannii]SSU28030.1 Uncharacterised protein [Acinetobacter baumannii]
MFLPVKRVSIQGYPSAPIVPCLDAEKPLLGVEGFSADTATCIGMRQEARHNLSGGPSFRGECHDASLAGSPLGSV